MPKYSRRLFNSVSVKFVDALTGKSVSFTVYDGDYEAVAEYAQSQIGHRYRTTELTDRRHKRR